MERQALMVATGPRRGDVTVTIHVAPDAADGMIEVEVDGEERMTIGEYSALVEGVANHLRHYCFSFNLARRSEAN